MVNLPGVKVEIGRLARFGIVGAIVTLIYSAATVFAVEILHLKPVAATIFGQLVAGGISYFGHSMFSFGVKTDHKTYLWRFLLIAALAFAMNIIITWLLTDVWLFSYRIAVAVVTVLIPLINYLCNRYWVFIVGLRNESMARDANASGGEM